jgi:hypothetical protein
MAWTPRGPRGLAAGAVALLAFALLALLTASASRGAPDCRPSPVAVSCASGSGAPARKPAGSAEPAMSDGITVPVLAIALGLAVAGMLLVLGATRLPQYRR